MPVITLDGFSYQTYTLAGRSGFQKCLFTMFFIFLCGMKISAQERCGTIALSNLLRERNLLREDDRKFENWLSNKIQNEKSRISTALHTFKIPVVVHVIHNGEAIGVGTNISVEQILSQIKVLNNDFKRLNADTLKTPTEFLPQVGKIHVEFVLAKQTPAGVATNGILRVRGTKNQWTINDDATLKGLSYWPAEDYLNIWVTDIASTILGYAQFPVSDLPGLEDAEDNRLTDGVVLDYRIVGSNDDGTFNLTSNFNKGRTATHEVGHFFGLRHIWGDDGGLCGGNGDYVDDTPDQGDHTNGCLAHPQTSCNVHTMFQNYMDYTNDVCMNLYTEEQVIRMTTVIENSPRRASLLTSNGSYDSAPVNNDLGIKEIISPLASECVGSIVPTLVLKNNGANKIISARLQLAVNSDIIETKDVSFASLESLQTVEVSFLPLVVSPGSNVFDFEILQTNATVDGKSNDNQKTITTLVPQTMLTPFAEKFNTMPQSWNVQNPDQENGWTIIQTSQIDNSPNKAAYMKFYNSQNEGGEKDMITTPVIDLSQATSPFFSFDVAYAQFQNHSDGLEVYALLNCEEITNSFMIYSKYGNSLATAPSTSLAFSPSGNSQWRREVIDLRDFIGQSRVQLAFVGVSDNGNNLYLDNVAFRGDVFENVAIKQVIQPSPVQCNKELQPLLMIENKGNVTIQSFKIRYSVNGGDVQTMSAAENFNLAPNEQSNITLPLLELADGENFLSFEIVEPNGFADIDLADNVMNIKTIVSDAKDKIPLRENFDADELQDQWEIVNPEGSMKWTKVSTNYNYSLHFKGYNSNSTMTDHAWFVSPVLDFSDAVTASLFFEVSYRYRNMDSIRDPGQGVFKVLASRDCGNKFEEVLLSHSETSISNISSENEWVPTGADDWKQTYINLTSLAGEENVRIAFVLANGISNNIYLDNLEFFVSDDPSPITPSDLYTVYGSDLESAKNFYITFNLANRQTIACELVDMMGRQVGTKEMTDVLNQTFKIEVENASSGIYLVRLLIDKKYYVSRILVGR